MAGIQQTPLRIPDAWSATWFRTFVTEVIAKADIRNALGIGVEIASDGNSVATLTVDSNVNVAAHNLDPLAHVEAFDTHKSESDPHAQYPLKSATTVADATGGATVDTECRAQLNALLAVLRVSGVIGT
jgi:hypothetical protein